MTKKILIGSALVALIAAYFFFDLGSYLTLEGIKQVADDAAAFYAENPVLVLAVFFLIYVAVTAASLPGTGAPSTMTRPPGSESTERASRTAEDRSRPSGSGMLAPAK